MANEESELTIAFKELAAKLERTTHIMNELYVRKLVERYGAKRAREILAEITASEDVVVMILRRRRERGFLPKEWWRKEE